MKDVISLWDVGEHSSENTYVSEYSGKSRVSKVKVDNLRRCSYKRNCYTIREGRINDKYYLAKGFYVPSKDEYDFIGKKDFVPSQQYIYLCKKPRSLEFMVGKSIVIELSKVDRDFIDRNKDRIVIYCTKEDVWLLRDKVQTGVFLVQRE
jgi:hypothetical protein